MEDEDDEATISTDTCFLIEDDIGTLEVFSPEKTKIVKSSNLPISYTIPNTSSDHEIEKISKIQKQISLYNKDLETDLKNLTIKKEDEEPSTKFVMKRKVGTTIEPIINLDKNIPSFEKNFTENQKEKIVNLKGTVKIKESFIEPPQRITKIHQKSFDSEENYQSTSSSSILNINKKGKLYRQSSATSTMLTEPLVGVTRFTTVRVNDLNSKTSEPELSNTSDKS